MWNLRIAELKALEFNKLELLLRSTRTQDSPRLASFIGRNTIRLWHNMLANDCPRTLD